MNLTRLLFNPFPRIGGAAALGFGLAAMVLAALIGAAQGLHFDGVLDAHLGPRVAWWLFVAEGLINWLSLAAALLVAGRMIKTPPIRVLDLFGTQALARWPALLTALACLAPGFHRYSEALIRSLAGLQPGQVPQLPAVGMDAVVFFLVTMFGLACTVWMVALMWQSFSHCCHARGGKAVAAFIIALLFAEGLSKTLIGLLFRAV